MDQQTAFVTHLRCLLKYTNRAALATAIAEYHAWLQRPNPRPDVASVLRACLKQMEPEAEAWDEALTVLRLDDGGRP